MPKLSTTESWNLQQIIVEMIKENGGFVNTHAHFDRAFTISLETLALADATLQEKWDLVDTIKRESSVDQIYDRMAQATELMISQRVKLCGTFIDVDEVIEDKAIQAAERLREAYKKDIQLIFINQALKGVLEPQAQEWFLRGAEFVDILGGLPGKDSGREEEHVDFLLETGKRLGKMVHVHVDQFNDPKEKETELLADKTLAHGMQGKVMGIHGVSIAALPAEARQSLYKKMVEAQLGLIVCPTAWIDSRRSEVLTPTHNSIAPVEELVAAGVTVAIGTDNIADIYKPFTDGNMWTELRFLLESCHYYDVQQLVKISTTNGRKVLGLNGE